MSALTEAKEIAAALRAGLVPRRGLTHFATGLESLTKAVLDELDFVAAGKGQSKWIRGEYGSGKTFAARHLCAQARAVGFATTEVQISINDTPLHHLETVYRRLVERLETAADGPNAFQAVVEGWLFQVGEEVRRVKGLEESDPAFADATEARLEDKLADISRRNDTFARVLRSYHRALHEGRYAEGKGLLSWLAGQPHSDRSVIGAAGVRGKVDGQAALTFLVGIIQLLRQSGYKGLVVVLDEVETIQRMNSQGREKSLNALRQLMDMLAAEQLPGMYLLVTGTRDFFEGYKGLKNLTPLYDRVHVKFGDDARWDNLRAPQVRLQPFDAERLFAVAKRIRDIYPADEPARVRGAVGDEFLRQLIEKVTAGFGGKVAIVPRRFLRELVDVLDRVDQHAAFDPVAHYQLSVDEAQLDEEELDAVRGEGPREAAENEEPSGNPGGRDARRRLDG
jgi:RecA/RadA recombinase